MEASSRDDASLRGSRDDSSRARVVPYSLRRRHFRLPPRADDDAVLRSVQRPRCVLSGRFPDIVTIRSRARSEERVNLMHKEMIP